MLATTPQLPASPLLGLPLEIIEYILDFSLTNSCQVEDRPDFLNYASYLALRSTCHDVRNITDLITAKNAEQYKRSNLSQTNIRLCLKLIEEWDCFSVPLPDTLRKGAPAKSPAQVPEPITSTVPDPPFWASKIPPISRHSCGECRRLLPSSSFANKQVSGAKAKDRDSDRDTNNISTSPFATNGKIAHRNKRCCIKCSIHMGMYTPNISVKFIEGWETEKPLTGVGFVCQRWTCRRFVKVKIGDKDEEVEGGVESKEYLRRTCARCLDYRKPAGEVVVPRGHVMH